MQMRRTINDIVYHFQLSLSFTTSPVECASHNPSQLLAYTVISMP